MAGMEERTFSEAELELFAAKYEVFQKAQADVEEVVTFLKKQHKIVGEEGWQIGQSGFFKMKEEVPAANDGAISPNGEEVKGKK